MKWIAGLLFCLVVVTGCVTEVVSSSEGEATLVVTRAGELATLSWKAEQGIVYVVMYADGGVGPRQWKVLPGAENLQAVSGDQITLSDHVPPGINRYYRLQILSVAR
ncbi:MAG TPA: hypothetical protein DCZ95_07630 [Verrucomicrobia bacterium]|nr:MAG: hypothetical protein A2X46_01180 [Lentisphaerae bacterium GWF2_57_35]HBA83945.1 hypothetical protein [Verrucomicrobiota bacterium]